VHSSRVLATEEFRIDKFIIRQYGKYLQIYFSAILDWNVTVDFSNLVTGTVLKVPSYKEIVDAGNTRGLYKLFRKG